MKVFRYSIVFIISIMLLFQSSSSSLAQQADSGGLSSVLAPDPFNKLSPINGAVEQSVSNLTLSWNPSSPGVTYEYCLRTNTNCPKPKWISVGTNTSVTVSGLSYNTRYFWEIRAVGPQNQITYADGGVKWSFRTNSSLPAAFNKLSPANGANSQPVNGLLLSWSTSNLATSYQYCYDTLNNNTCDTTWRSTTSQSATINSLAYNTTYYWQVRAVNARGSTQADAGTWFIFQTQTPSPGAFGKSVPDNYSIDIPTSLTLRWEANLGIGVTYEYCVSTVICSASSSWVPAGTNLYADIAGLEYGTTYYWQVRAQNSGGTVYADNNTNWIFSTNIAAPSDFGKTNPGNNEVGEALSLTLYWDPSLGTNIQYQFCYNTIPCDESSTWLVAGTNTTADISGLAYSTTYYWQVRAVNPAGTTYANANTVWQFTTIAAPPQPFTKLNPPSTSPTDVPVNTTLQWSASTYATSYQYCWDTVAHVDNDATCSNPTSSGWVVNASTVTANLDLASNQTYYWQVRAINDYGSLLADNGVWFHFTTVAIPAGNFVKYSPGNGAADQSLTPWLYWFTTHNANTTYEYCYYPTGSNCTGRWNTVIENAPIHITTDLLRDTTYYWQVRYYPNGADPSTATYADDNTEWSFTTLKTAPTCTDQLFPDAVENTPYADQITNYSSSYTPIFSLFGNPPAGALVLASNGSFNYTPVQNFTGSVSFQFVVADGHNPPAGPCTATIVVNFVDNPPSLIPIPDMRAPVGTRISFWLSATDPDIPYGDALTFSVGGILPAGASIDPLTGLFTWDIPANQRTGEYILTFLVTDSYNESASQQMTISLYDPFLYLPKVIR